MRKLESELDKVFTFQKFKTEEIIKRIMGADVAVNDVTERIDVDPIDKEQDFMLLEEDLGGIIAEVHDLAKFTQLNHTGFQKIIKKHDVSKSPWNYGRGLTIAETKSLQAQAYLRCTTTIQSLLRQIIRRVDIKALEAS